MSNHKYSWIVLLSDGASAQVNADAMQVIDGAAVFMHGSDYMAAVFAAGEWCSASIMSQATGLSNGWTDLGVAGEGKRGDDPEPSTQERKYLTRSEAADLISRRFFPVSRRSLEVWPLTWRTMNGRALCSTKELLEVAQAKMRAASPPKGGRP